MWAGLISVLWWQMQWLICFHGIMNIPKSLLHLDTRYQKGSNLITPKDFSALLFFHHTVSHTNTHTVRRIVLEMWLRPASLTFIGLEPEHSLHMNHSLSDDEAI